MFNLKKKNSGFSRFEGNIFFSIKHQTQSVNVKSEIFRILWIIRLFKQVVEICLV